jgi:hypothetical protein
MDASFRMKLDFAYDRFTAGVPQGPRTTACTHSIRQYQQSKTSEFAALLVACPAQCHELVRTFTTMP